MNRVRAWGQLSSGMLALSITACATRAPAPTVTQPAPVSGVSTVVASTQPGAVAPRFLDAIPTDLAPELAQQLGVLSDMCNVAMRYETEGAHRVRVGCRSCPPFAGPAAVSDGRIALDGKDFFALELYLSGHFTAADADQRLAVFDGCEAVSESGGGTLIAERQGNQFRALRYVSSLRPQACEAFHRPDGRDLAVCELSDVRQSSSTDSLSVVDFAVDPPKVQTLLSFTNQDPCSTEPGTRTTEEQIESFELNQNPAAKNNGLVVRTRRTARNMDDAYQRYCRENTPGSPAHEKPFSKPQVTTLHYRFDGESFVLR